MFLYIEKNAIINKSDWKMNYSYLVNKLVLITKIDRINWCYLVEKAFGLHIHRYINPFEVNKNNFGYN